MLTALQDKLNAGYGDTETEVLRKLLTGKKTFSSVIEEYIAEQQKATGLSRDNVVQMLILESLQIRDERFRLPKAPPKKK